MAKKATQPIPQGMQGLTTHMWFNGNCRKAIDFYKQAFGAEVRGAIVDDPNNERVMHAMLKLGDTHIMVADAIPGGWEQGPTSGATMGFWMYVEDVDVSFQKAREAGCKVLMEVEDSFWGDRMGKLKDPFGHTWALASQRWIYTEEEIQQNQEEWSGSLEEED